jgi:hypothetical protein
MRFWSWAQFRLGVSLVYPTADDVGPERRGESYDLA